MGGVGREEYLEMIELLGSEIIPQLGAAAAPAMASSG
jgi:hypothetical protein